MPDGMRGVQLIMATGTVVRTISFGLDRRWPVKGFRIHPLNGNFIVHRAVSHEESCISTFSPDGQLLWDVGTFFREVGFGVDSKGRIIVVRAVGLQKEIIILDPFGKRLKNFHLDADNTSSPKAITVTQNGTILWTERGGTQINRCGFF